MPTKPTVAPIPWAINLNYTTGPFIGSALKVAPPPALAAEGHRPGALFPTSAEYVNYNENAVVGTSLWVLDGTFNPDPDAHIVETDATGRAGLHALTVVDTADEAAVQISGSNTVSPTVSVACSSNATRVQVDLSASSGIGYATECGTGASVGYDLTMNNSPAGARGIRASGNAGTAGVPLAVTQQGTGNTANFDSARVGGTVGVYMTSNRSVALTLDATGPLGTTLRMVPRTNPAVATGATWIDITSGWVEYYDQLATRKRVWSSSTGITLSPSSYIAATSAAFAVTTQIALIAAFSFVAGQRYRVTMSCRLGRAAGSTQNAQMSCTINGVGLSYSGQIVQLFQAGGAGQLEMSWIGDDVFTAGTTGTYLVNMQVTPVGGVGSLQAGQRSIIIMGAYD